MPDELLLLAVPAKSAAPIANDLFVKRFVGSGAVTRPMPTLPLGLRGYRCVFFFLSERADFLFVRLEHLEICLKLMWRSVAGQLVVTLTIGRSSESASSLPRRLVSSVCLSSKLG